MRVRVPDSAPSFTGTIGEVTSRFASTLLMPMAACLLLAAAAHAQAGADAPDPIFDTPSVPLASTYEVAERIRKLPIVKARFVQTKQVKALTRPMISEGRFVFSRESGVYWEVEKPFPSRFVVTPEGSLKRDGKLSADRPEIRAFSKIFLSLFSGSLAEIGEHFEAHYAPGDRWTIGLRARDARMGRHLSAIVLSGTNTVDAVSLFEGGGDSSRIEFESIETPESPSLEDRALFQ